MISEERLKDLRTAALVGQRMAGLQPHTVQVKPDELSDLVEEIIRLRPVAAAAQPVGLLWEDEGAIRSSQLEVLANAVMEALPHPDPAPYVASSMSRYCEGCSKPLVAGEMVRFYADDVYVHDECPRGGAK